MSSEPSGDPYAPAKATIRETTKWLVASLGALASFFVGATPSLEFTPWSWWLLVAFVLIGVALYFVVQVLLPCETYWSELVGDKESEIRSKIDGRASDLLPHPHKSIIAFAAAIDALRGKLGLDAAEHEKLDAAEHEKLTAAEHENLTAAEHEKLTAAEHEKLVRWRKSVDNLLHLANYLALSARFKTAWKWLSACAVLIALCLIIYALGTFKRQGGEEKPMIVYMGNRDSMPARLNCPPTSATESKPAESGP